MAGQNEIVMSETERTKQKLNDRLLHVRLEGVGPITRSTLDPGRVDTEWEALSDLVYWCWCCRFQGSRLQASLLNEFTSWGKLRRVLAERAFGRASYDEHCLLVAATNLDRALRRSKALIGESPIAETTREILSNVVAGAGQAARCSISSPSLNFFPAKTWTISSEPLSLRQRVSA